MEAGYTINNLPLFGGILIFLLVLFTSGGEIFAFLGAGGTGLPSGTGLPKGGYRYYIGSKTVLYILPQKTRSRCRVYILEGQPPEGFRVHQKRTTMHIVVPTGSSAQAEILLERAYKQ